MGFLKKLFLLQLQLVLLAGCQLGYLTQSAYHQIGLLNARVDIDEALADPKITDEEKRKIRLAVAAKDFAEKELGLKAGKNYSTYVKLNRPYVVYAVNAASPWELKHYEWSYPFVGKMPYKGYFNEKDALELEQQMQREGFDTFVRGVSAYSTLGWFSDPILSSMMTYEDADLVDTIIHESTHATLYIENSADFNERLASFVGGLGAQLYYTKLEGPDSPMVKKMNQEQVESALFSQFISKEITDLEEWYRLQTDHDEAKRQERFRLIQAHYNSELAPKLKLHAYKRLAEGKINNAYILLFKTYDQDLGDFKKLYDKVGQNFHAFLDACMKLQKSKDPALDLKALLNLPDQQ